MKRRPTIRERIKALAHILRGGSYTLLDDAAVEAFGGTGGRLLLDWVARGVDINDEIRGDMARVRARARDLAKSNAYIKQFMNMVAVNGIGPTGFAINAQVMGSDREPDDDINTAIEEAWRAWASEPVTVDGKMDLVGAQMMLAKGVVRDGEAFVRLWRGFKGNAYGLALEIIDPDAIDEQYNRVKRTSGETEINMGVELGDFRRPVAYHAWDGDAGITSAGRRKRVPIPASDVVHLYLPDRVAQVRGYTCIYPAMIPARMLRGYTDAALVTARAATAKMGFIKPNPDAPAPADIGSAKPTQLTWDASPGTIQMLPPGHDFEQWDPNFPSEQFPEFVKAVLREIATGLGVSYNSLGNDLDGVTYSSMRSGMLIERDLWRVFHAWWCFSFLRPVYEQWLRTSLLTPELQLGSRDFTKFRRVKWTPRGWRWVDPLKDVQAGVIGLQNGLASRTQLLDEQGIDFEDTLKDLAREKRLAAKHGVIIDGPPHGAVNLDDEATAGGYGKPAKKNGGPKRGVRPAVARWLLELAANGDGGEE